jgi:hypothetical protein
MGAGNVVLAILNWSARLNDKPFRALVLMAVQSMDDGDPPRYWAGWAPIATAVGASFPASCAAHDATRCSHGPDCRGRACRGCKGCQAARRAAARAIQGLLEAGAVRLLKPPALGRNAEYALELHIVPLPVDKAGRYGSGSQLRADQRMTPSVTRTQDSRSHAYAGLSESGTRDSESPAEEKQEQDSGTEAGTRSPESGTSPAPVDKCAHGDPLGFIDSQLTVPRCGDCRRAARSAT